MSFTRIQAEKALVQRSAELLAAVGFSTAIDGFNTNLDGPISYAMLKLGYTVEDPTNVDTDEIGLIATDEWPAFLDLATLSLYRDIYGNVVGLVDITVGPRRELLSQIAKGLETRMEKMGDWITAEYGIGVGTVSMGSIDLGFQAAGDDTIV